MSVPDAVARRRWLTIVGVRLAGSAGAVLGLLLWGRGASTGPRLIGIALILAALWMLAVVPRALAQRWRSGGR